MDMILSADKAWGIGRSNSLLFTTKGDMKHFRAMTVGKTVVMGRRTLESLPGGKPLPDRQNIVLTRDLSYVCAGAVVCRSIGELFDYLGAEPDDKVMVIGGEQIYRMLTPYCSRAYVTRWQAEAQADSFAPDLDSEPNWQLLEQSGLIEESGVSYRLCVYQQERPEA